MNKIISIATAVPQFKHSQSSLRSFADETYGNDERESRILKFLYNQSGIVQRYSVLEDFNETCSNPALFKRDQEIPPTVADRMHLYSETAPALAMEAIEKCLDGKISKNEITHLITVSCTGMSAPGLDLQLVDLMDLPATITRTSINFMGCYAAVHAMKLANAFCCADENANVLVVCLELCTLHFQNDKTEDNITSTLLFGDGAAAFLMQANSQQPGICIDSFYSKVIKDGKDDMAWKISERGFLMTLSSHIPALVKQDFSSLTSAALQKSELTEKDVAYWCIHPGGKKILQAIEHSMKLSENDLQYSYQVLREYGNMSAPTILFVLQQIFDNAVSQENNGHIFGAAFGPGLTMETFIAHYA